MDKYLARVLLEYPVNSGCGQLETLIAEGDSPEEAAQNAANAYASKNPDDPAATPYDAVLL
jgi:hypothetical protein